MKEKLKSKVAAAVFVAAVVCSIPVTSALADTGDVLGGWTESEGSFIAQARQGEPLVAARSNPQHGGQAQGTTINGTSHKRAIGWTTWQGVNHYTRAQLVHYWPNSGIIADSGRVWGWNYTEASTIWVAFNPNAASNGHGQAQTFYGN